MELKRRGPNFQNTGDIEMNVYLSDTGTRFKGIVCTLRVLMRARMCVHIVSCAMLRCGDMVKAECVKRKMNLGSRRVFCKSSEPLGKISASGGRRGNDDAEARTADPSASRRNALSDH